MLYMFQHAISRSFNCCVFCCFFFFFFFFVALQTESFLLLINISLTQLWTNYQVEHERCSCWDAFSTASGPLELPGIELKNWDVCCHFSRIPGVQYNAALTKKGPAVARALLTAQRVMITFINQWLVHLNEGDWGVCSVLSQSLYPVEDQITATHAHMFMST